MSYLVESGFSHVSPLLTKVHNRIDIVKRGDLWLTLTSMEPDIEKLAERHQPQGSHRINLHLFYYHARILKWFINNLASVHI